MAKLKKAFECKNCGHTQTVWAGKCPECGKWGTLIEKTVKKESSSKNPISIDSDLSLIHI